MAVAASFLLALWLGTLFQPTRIETPTAPVDGPGATSVADLADRAVDQPRGALPIHPDANPWRIVTVSGPPGTQDAGVSFDVPAVEREKVDPQWLQSLPSPIPDNVVQALSRTGHRVQQRRELVHIPLKDGRRLVVPVDQVDVKYVPDTSY